MTNNFFLEGGKNNKISWIRDGGDRVLFWNKVHCCWGVKCVYSLCFQNNLPPRPHLLYTYQNLFSKNLPLFFSHMRWEDGSTFVGPSSSHQLTHLNQLDAFTHKHTHTHTYRDVHMWVLPSTYVYFPFIRLLRKKC